MSNFCDKTSVLFTGGNGGDGAISFRREKHIPRGGPDGGDGGNGGDIVLMADENSNTLMKFNSKKQFKAPDGGDGAKKQCFGRNGKDLILSTPAGTLIMEPETKEIIVDLKKHGQTYIIAKGGRGGLGNLNFASSIHQAPRFAENGEEGKSKTVLMELQLVADIGIIGFPSAGKSTLISRISNARPKIAAYPFTTLIPNLGVVDMRDFDKSLQESFVVADIPGLIEGAHKGKGLGHEFLRHVSRTEILVHLIDPTRNDPADYKTINAELEAHDKRLATKEQIVVVSKHDAMQQEDLDAFIEELKEKNPSLKKKEISIISSITGEGLKGLVFKLFEEVKKLRKEREERLQEELSKPPKPEEEKEKVFRPHLKEKRYEVHFVRKRKDPETGKERRTFDVTGDRIEQVVEMTDIANEEGLERVYHFLRKMGIKKELQQKGATPGDRIRIAKKIITMRP